MTTITINTCVYSVYPIYDLYASDENGNIINIIKKVPHKGNKKHNGYLNVCVRKHGHYLGSKLIAPIVLYGNASMVSYHKEK